ncbi:MAG TPA: type 1 glutamine amidotransferase [Steroidobacteraceae bacterium]|nr:type 1 glutamine amidotransferase [Steroidobacteraceae bacterium]
MLRILIVDGNTRDTNTRHIACGGVATGDNYARVLRKIYPELAIDIIHPADQASRTHTSVSDFDGLVWTGSALNAWRLTAEVRSQVELARRALQTSVPIFGSCWGLQITAIAAGGAVAPARNGREIVIARNIELTEAGRGHPMFSGKTARFDAVAVHADEVVTRPAAMRVLATNAHSPVQAAEIALGGGFWGTQYHPEYSLQEIAIVMRRYGDRLLEDGTYPSAPVRDLAINELSELGRDPGRSDLAAKYHIGASVLDAGIHHREILNWLTLKVAPAASARARG